MDIWIGTGAVQAEGTVVKQRHEVWTTSYEKLGRILCLPSCPPLLHVA